MRLIVLAAFAFVFASGVDAQESAPKPYAIDGDTIGIGQERMRLLGLDTPETYGANCAAEAMKGYEAAGRLQRLINSRAVRIERQAKRDKYKRSLGRLYVGGEDAGEILIREGHAVAYDGRSKRTHWAKTLCNLDEPRKALNGFIDE